jgi:hypothetical protein
MKGLLTCLVAMVVAVGCAKDQKVSAAAGPKPSYF